MSKEFAGSKRLFNWSSKSDAAKDDQWNMFMRSLTLKLDDESPSIGYITNETSSLNVRKKVLKVLEIPAGLAAEGQCAVTLFLASREDRATAHRVALAWNKRIDECYKKAIIIVQGLFSETINAATCVGAALKACEGKPVIKFRGVMEALAAGYEPSGIVAAIELKDELKSWTDTGKTHTDWEAGLLQLTSKLTKLKQDLPKKEIDQIIIKNVQNEMIVPMSRLILDVAAGVDWGERTYDSADFRRDVMVLAKNNAAVNLWGLAGERRVL